jgi:hypothetical protein
MKKLFLLIAVMMFLGSRAWALPDNVSATEYSGSQSIKATGGSVFWVNVNAAGVTAGDKVQLLDGGASGTVRWTCIVSTGNATGNQPCTSSTVADYFGTSIYLKETKAGGGTFYTDIQLF